RTNASRSMPLSGAANASSSVPQQPKPSTRTASIANPTHRTIRASLGRESLIRSLHAPEWPDDFGKRPAGLVGLQAISKQRDDIGAHLRIGDEITVAERVSRPPDLNHIDFAERPKLVDLMRGEHCCIDAPETRDASEQPPGRFERLVVRRCVKGDLEFG